MIVDADISSRAAADSHDLIRVQGARVNNHDGGRIVFEGTPADLVAAKSTLTGKHLAAFVGNNR